MKPYVISLCCGAGLGEEGIKVHFRTALALDSDWRCCCSHMANHPGVLVQCADICSARTIEIAKRFVQHCHGIVATPPCPCFSTAGPRQPDDPRAGVSFAVLRWLKELDPDFLVLENVLSMKRHEVYGRLVQGISAANYSVVEWVLRAEDIGVPQRRQRLFLVAVRNNMPCPIPPDPTHGPGLLPLRTLRDAIGSLKPGEATALGCVPLSNTRLAIMERVSAGGDWRVLNGWRREAALASCRGRRPHPRTCRRLAWDRPAPTVLSGPQAKHLSLLVHPAEGRHLSVLECLLLQGAPPGFRVLGSLKQRYAQVGNGVPPALMAAVCGAVAKALGSGVDGNFPCQEKRCGVNAAG